MRQIYILASDADRLATDEIETLLKQRGYLVRRAEEVRAFPPAQPQEVTLALWSRAVQFSARQIPFTNRAIDAWTEGRLVFARLDHTLLPRGLGDVEAIDLSFPPARNAAVWRLIEAAQQIDRAAEARRRAATDSPDECGPKSADAGNKDAPGAEPEPPARGRPFSVEKAAMVGVVAAAAFGSVGFLSMPFAPDWLLGSAGLAWGTVAGSVAGYAGVRPLAMASAPDLEAQAAPQPAPAERSSAAAEESSEAPPAPVFVSYSRRNGEVVFPLVAEVEAAGRDVWIDRDEIAAGGNWAGSIVRAIRASETFCLMCSAEAFQSDNVRREIYIADKYKRKLLPVRLDSAEMPEDFEYFLIDRQWLDLTAIEPGERADRLKAALGR